MKIDSQGFNQENLEKSHNQYYGNPKLLLIKNYQFFYKMYRHLKKNVKENFKGHACKLKKPFRKQASFLFCKLLSRKNK